MKTYGIICEYNPFHNGHIYQIEETKKNTGADHIVAVMSGNFVQRGEPALMDKFKRAEIAVKNGADLVIELPVQYSLANAELFARCGVMLLGALRCVEGISFGSECGSVEDLQKCADAVREVSTPENIKPLLEKGVPYPEAVQQLVSYKYGPLVGDLLNSPNNILAVEYLKSLKILGLDKIKPYTVKRSGAEHDGEEHSENIASGSYIRRLIDDGEDFSAFVPKETLEAVNAYDDNDLLCWFENFERVILYRLRTMSPPELAATPDVGQGLENRIFQAARVATSLDDLLEKIKVPRYPMARIKRILFNALLGIKLDDLKVPPMYGRILALNDRGTDILKLAGSLPEDKLSIPFSSSLKDFMNNNNNNNKNLMRSIGMATVAGDIYTLGSRNIRPSGMDFTSRIFFDKIEGFTSELPADLKTNAHMGPADQVQKEIEEERKRLAAAAAKENNPAEEAVIDESEIEEIVDEAVSGDEE